MKCTHLHALHAHRDAECEGPAEIFFLVDAEAEALRHAVAPQNAYAAPAEFLQDLRVIEAARESGRLGVAVQLDPPAAHVN